MHYDVRHGILWRAFVFVSWCLLGMACSDHALPVEQLADEAPRVASLPKQPAQQTAPASADWTAEVQKRMANGERAIRAEGTNSFRITNRKQGLTAKVDSTGGLHIEPRTGGALAVHVQLASVGREGAALPVGVTSVGLGACASDGAIDEMGACLKRLEVQRGSVVEWWESRENGLEQGFVFDHRPEGRGLLELHVAVEGAQVEVSGDHASSATLRVDERTAWEYAGLSVVDAKGKALESWMERDDAGGVRIVVDDEGAAYPVVVDPVLSTTADWTAESDQANAQFGTSVASAGDVNGDGFGDVIVGAPGYDNGEAYEGRAYVYLGSASGLGTTAIWTAESNQTNAYFGSSVASAGDVNGDGFGDVIVGAPNLGQFGGGGAYVYLGSASGLDVSAAWNVTAYPAAAQFGVSVASAGDVNGDGYGDVIVGAPGEDDNGFATSAGAAYVYLGSAVGLAATYSWQARGYLDYEQLGSSVASAGDVNGDGFGDVIVGAPYYDNGSADEGSAFVYLGSASGLSPVTAWVAESDQAFAYFGASVASAGDVNGDGFGDVIVGAYGYDNGQSNEGRVFVYLGSTVGLSPVTAWVAESDQANANFGNSVTSAGDVNGDGYGDVIVGARQFDNGQTDEGRAFVYLGSALGLGTTAAWTAESDQEGAFFGNSVTSAGDVNDDGFGDVIVGAPLYDNGSTDEGSAFVYLGSPAGLPSVAGWTAESIQGGAFFGTSVASAGDVNGDGYSDVIVGAYRYDNGETDEGRAFVYLGSASGLETTAAWTAESNQANASFGVSVSSAGDVNGDGFGDVIVGAPQFDNVEANEGRAFVYLGSPSGLAPTAVWTAESDQTTANFGRSVASAGDVNGDGFGDVIIGAPQFDNGETNEGRAYVYLGNASGLGTTAAWTAESDQATANFGTSVSSAGDVNGDGFGDVIVGAPQFDTDAGRAFLYLGGSSPMGLATTAAWTAASDQAGAEFGTSVASAGDVNGDGFGDVIVGAPRYDNGQSDEGRAYVYLGSATGLQPTAVWMVEANQNSASFGNSVASAGDVNGDGFGDVIVAAYFYDNGETDEGRAYVYLGNASGLATTAAWTAESDQAGAVFGWSVASAEDVNGDGFGDIIVGAPYYDNGQPDKGRAFVYSVPSSGRPHLRLSDPAANRPLSPWNALVGSSVRATALGATPFGRLMVKAEVEAKPLGVAFDGQGTTLSPNWTPGFSGGAFQDLVTDVPLVQAKPHHLRWRLRYRPSDGWPAVASRWIYPPLSGDARGVHFRFGVCGNSLIEGDEACDDGNILPSDGCSRACKWENGVGCMPSSASTCESGFCVDGVCCDSACTGLCQACTAQLKGSGVDGECGYFAEGTDPQGDCTLDAPSTCQRDGVCDGSGACRLWASGTLCGSNACAGNVLKLATCNGLGTCLLELIGTDCGPNSCDPAVGQCITGCADDTGCTADAYCDTSLGQCKPKAQLGFACTSSAQCQSGHCIDTVCCNEACDGTCRACNAGGICSIVTAGTPDDACVPDPLNLCGNSGVCTGAGTCDFATNDIQCAAPTCANGSAQTSTCNGKGACVATTTPCGDYACGVTSCNTSCTTNLDCAPFAYCDKGQCKPGAAVKCPSDCKGRCETGVCTAAGTCERKAFGEPCGGGEGICSDGRWYGSQRCNDDGECKPDPITESTNCHPYQCVDATSCKNSCSSDSDCVLGHGCQNNECYPTCSEMKMCPEGSTCDPTTNFCNPTKTKPQGCTCQTPGSRPADPLGAMTSVMLALLMLRRVRWQATSSRKES